MDGASLVVQARKKLRDLVKDESRGWGDDGNALRRIAEHGGMSFSYLWRLLYKSKELKDVRSTVLLELSLAHQELRERQMRHYENDRDGTQATGWITETLIRAADALAGKDDPKAEDAEGKPR